VVVTRAWIWNALAAHLQYAQVVVDKLPLLLRWRMWRKRAGHRAGAACEIDDRERRQCS
jgi:hypothetical protein